MPLANRDRSCAVLYSTDAAFLGVTCISARSMAESCIGPLPAVTILLHGISSASAGRAKAYLEKAGLTVHLVHVDPAWCEPWASKRGQSAAKFGLLRLSEWFEESIDRVVVVDSDTRFVGDVAELMRLDLKGHPIGAVADTAMIADGKLPALTRKLGLSIEAGYFNSGLLVVDIHRWKALGVERAAQSVFIERPEILTFNDQCALNATIAGDWLRLPLRWNHLNGSADRNWPVALIHFAGHFKPWSLGLVGMIGSVASFVGRENIAYYKIANQQLQNAGLGRISLPIRNTLHTLWIYAKWRLTGKFSMLLRRSRSEDMQSYLAEYPEQVR
jgi:lipopolysaccharide biosynthesis glycosyltransferase